MALCETTLALSKKIYRNILRTMVPIEETYPHNADCTTVKFCGRSNKKKAVVAVH